VHQPGGRRAANNASPATATEAAQRGCAIVFVDEIDAIGKARVGSSAASGHDERESTLNQLLVEMDGFRQDQVVVLAATNRPDTLDPALLRPGRFDRQVTVPAPDRGGRTRILRIHLRSRHVADDVDVDEMARRTTGFTGADLANLANQAALAAVRAGADQITLANLEEALATVMLGPARRSVEVAERDRTITAWHEAGHALAGLLQADAEDPVQVTIVPRGAARGVTWFTTSDGMFLTRRQARAQLVVAMAGRARLPYCPVRGAGMGSGAGQGRTLDCCKRRPGRSRTTASATRSPRSRSAAVSSPLRAGPLARRRGVNDGPSRPWRYAPATRPPGPLPSEQPSADRPRRSDPSGRQGKQTEWSLI